MNHYVYEVINIINNKKYIGKRSCSCEIEDDKYLGSGTELKKAIKEYGIENFNKNILEVCDNEKQVYDKERYYIKMYNASESDEYYNIKNGSEGVKLKKQPIKVICNYPTPENIEKFQEIMCDGLAKALIKCKPKEWIDELKYQLKCSIEKENNN